MSCEYNARSGKTSNSGSREVGVVNLQDNLLTYTSSFVKEYTCLRGGKGRFNPLTCKKTPAVEHFCYSGDIHALSSFLLISIYVYSKLSEPWEWIVYKPKKILDYSKNHTNPPLMPPPNYHATVVTQARVVCLICPPEARGPVALGLRVYISGRPRVPVLQLLCNTSFAYNWLHYIDSSTYYFRL